MAFFHLRVPEFLQERTQSFDSENCSVLSGVLMDGSILALCLLVQQNTLAEEVLKIYFVCLNARVLW